MRPADIKAMEGRVCVVTGATAGIGLETARGIAQQGATVVIVGRSPEKCSVVARQISDQTGNSNVAFLVSDLSMQNEIRRLAAELKDRYPRIHVLVNNAGGLFMNGQSSPAGVEMTLALNHLGYFLLTSLLLDTLRAGAPARIINVSSFVHTGVRIDFSRLRWGGWGGYKRSKLANILFTYELARRLNGTGITANALSPGLVASNFGKNNRGYFRLLRPMLYWFAINKEQGAQTSIYLACSPEVEGVTGKYFEKRTEKHSSNASYDRDAAARLWQVSADMTGMKGES
jgi:NAD(P)-dependent dehydrogenase (short-subunit alcohol dehydrogenase family)